jgi:hypothetical protein
MKLFKIKHQNNYIININKPKIQKAIIIKNDKLVYYSNFFHRYAGFVYDKKKKKFIDDFFITKQLTDWVIKKFLNIKFLNLEFSLPEKIFFLFNFFIKKITIQLKDNEIILFGPWSNIYFHQIFEWLTRIFFIKSEYKIIYLPDHLKKFLSSKIYKSVFKDVKFKFYSTKKNYIFYNASYLTYIDPRKINYVLSKTLNKLKNEVRNKFNKLKKSKKYEFILVSREKASRKIINENELFKRLKNYGFKKVLFEDYSINEQIYISSQAKIMIGYEGSGLANMIYMKKNSLLIKMSNKYVSNSIFKNVLCKILELKYKEFVCKKSFKNLDAICDVDKIEKFIKNYLLIRLNK